MVNKGIFSNILLKKGVFKKNYEGCTKNIIYDQKKKLLTKKNWDERKVILKICILKFWDKRAVKEKGKKEKNGEKDICLNILFNEWF